MESGGTAIASPTAVTDPAHANVSGRLLVKQDAPTRKSAGMQAGGPAGPRQSTPSLAADRTKLSLNAMMLRASAVPV